MKYRTLGQSDIVVSEIGFGAWTIGDDWWGRLDDRTALTHIGRALDLGITFFDTADAYGDGRSERLLGQALESSRDEVVIATKFGYDIADSHADRARHQERKQNFSPDHVRKSLEASLHRLRTDWVDLYQLHNPKMDSVLRDDTFAVLEELKAEGKIREYGVALGPRIGWRDEGLHAIANRSVASIHMIFNLLEQEPGKDLLEAAQRRQIGSLVRVPLSSGLLEGKYTSDTVFPSSDHRSHRERSWLMEGLQKVEKLRFLEIEGLRTLAQASIQFILSSRAVSSVLPTVRTLEQIEEYAAASDSPPLDDSDLAEIQRLYAQEFDLARGIAH